MKYFVFLFLLVAGFAKQSLAQISHDPSKEILFRPSSGAPRAIAINDLENSSLLEPASPEIKERLQKRFDILFRADVSYVGLINISAVYGNLNSLKFKISKQGFFESNISETSLAGRQFAVNIGQKKLVILNHAFWSEIEDSPAADFLLIHEALGALGVHDDNYEVTVFAHYVTSFPLRLNELKNKMSSQKIVSSCRVGCGGDLSELMFKAVLIHAVGSMPWNKHTIPLKNVRVESLILNSRIFSLSKSEMEAKGWCAPPIEKLPSFITKPDTCGFFQVQNGEPTIGISKEWGKKLFENLKNKKTMDYDSAPLSLKILEQIKAELHL